MGSVPEPTLILGASGGIGTAIARRLVHDGHPAILHGRNATRLETLVAELGPATQFEVGDLTDEEEVKVLFGRIASRHSKLGGVVFSVATPFPTKLTHRVSWSAFQYQIDTQLKALHLVASAALPLLSGKERTRRLIVVGTEAVVLSPPVKKAAYVAAKAAATAYAKVIAKEWLGRGVRVHIIAPGLVKTALVADMPDEFLDQIAETMPEGKLTSAEDVAALTAFLMTDAADPLYGIPLRVSRGDRT
jgi:3-oxoacyl-[acyl-carrier protein] reductase